jgi:hypothetical protein
MKLIISYLCVALSVIAIAGPAEAKGCLAGAVVGGAAGHYTGHHGLIGAAAGCVIGRHEARKHELEQRQGNGDNPNNPTYR